MLEDRAGVRWVDFHPGAASATRVILPRVSWNGSGFYLRSLASGESATNAEYSVPAGGDVNLAQLTPTRARAASPGRDPRCLHPSLRARVRSGGAGCAALRRGAERTAPPPPGTDLSPPRGHRSASRGDGAVVVGGASLATAGALGDHSARLHDQALTANGERRAQLNQDIARAIGGPRSPESAAPRSPLRASASCSGAGEPSPTSGLPLSETR